MISADNKRIAKNTLMLYFRMLVMLLVSLYTSRIVLNVLGVEDYGVYNVVGGIIAMFGFITGTLATAAQRFLSFDLGKGDTRRLRETFSLVMLAYLILLGITLVLSEPIGVWFLNTQMTIPAERLSAANWVLQCTILSFTAGVLTAPYMAVIIAREHMSIYAYTSIADAVLRLVIVWLLEVAPADKLKVYAVLLLTVSIGMATFYRFYCKRHFPESRYVFFFDRRRFFELCSFAVWNVVGAIANTLRSQGLNILLNLFFNPAVNAARGIAFQVNGAVTRFTGNFYAAIRPALTKDFAAGRLDAMKSLALNGSRAAFFLMLVLSFPIFMETEGVLRIWLKIVPDHAVFFVQLTLLQSLLEVIPTPLTYMLQSAGRIKELQSTISVFYLLVVPVSYVFLKFGFPPETVFLVNVVFVVLNWVPRWIICKKVLGLGILDYHRRVSLNIAVPVTALVAWGIVCKHYGLLPFPVPVNFCLHACIALLAVTFLGAKKNERRMAAEFVVRKFRQLYGK